jgi:hypothetical protein
MTWNGAAWDTVGAVGILPTAIASLVGWYDFADPTVLFTNTAGTAPIANDGDLIARINDKSGAGHNATQITSANRPTYKVNIQNSLSIARGDGTRGPLFIGALLFSGVAHTVFTAHKLAATGGTGQLFGIGNASSNGIMYGYNGGYLTAVPNGAVNVNASIEAVVWCNTCGYYAAATGGYFLNNGQIFNPGSNWPSTTVLVAPSGTATWLMAYADGSNAFNGDMGELIVYNRALNALERRLVSEYLASKWAV